MSNAAHAPQLKVPAVYMRGGTSKGVFFRLEDLPAFAREPGPERDAFLLRVIGSPDPYQKQIDGLGNGSSSTSKVVILSRSERDGHDVNYLFGQVAIDRPVVDWSGNCGNLSAAVGAFAIHAGFVSQERIPQSGHAEVRIWQENIGKTILTRVPVTDGEVQETGDFELDGVTFPAAGIEVTFTDPAAGEGALFPTGQLTDTLDVPDLGPVQATLINAGIPTVFVNAAELGFSGVELQEEINANAAYLAKLEAIRVAGSMKMGLTDTPEAAMARAHTPKVAFVSPPASYTASSGKIVAADDIDLNVRAMSMGKLHHAMMGTAAVAIATAAAIPGTLVNIAAGGQERRSVLFGHPSGTLQVGAAADCIDNEWIVESATMTRSARVLMEGFVRAPKS